MAPRIVDLLPVGSRLKRNGQAEASGEAAELSAVLFSGDTENAPGRGVGWLAAHYGVTCLLDRLALDEVDVFGVRSSPNAYPELISLIAAGKVNARRLVSRVYPLEQINAAFEAFRRREGGAIRMVIKV